MLDAIVLSNYWGRGLSLAIAVFVCYIQYLGVPLASDYQCHLLLIC